MRTIFLLRGAPGAGKSTWIRENNLEPYTISADAIRLLYVGPVVTEKGNLAISQEQDNRVWDLLMDLLEQRMDRGEFLIVDATHYKASLLQKYKKLIGKYRYRAYVVDFTDIPIETAKQRNITRDAYKMVPEAVIDKMYAVFKSDFKEVSNQFKIITREEALAMMEICDVYDYNAYKRVYVIGDIHGCWEPLRKFFEEYPMNDESAYIFVGDYLDRGIQNKEVIEFLLSVKDKKNVLLLEGNHERWLRMYSEKDYPPELTPIENSILKKYAGKDFWYKRRQQTIRNHGFIKNTAPALTDFNKKDLRQLCRKLIQMAYIRFGDKRYFITHAGIPCLPRIEIATSQYIEGTGKYEDIDALYDHWIQNTDENEILVHGHRNVFEIPAKQRNGRCYNLDSSVEYGHKLRILKITPKQERILEYENPIFDPDLKPHKIPSEEKPIENNTELLRELENSTLINKKRFDNGITSYNFTHQAFYDRKWNQLTCTARGLFVKDGNVVARSYNKFFNWDERPETESPMLAKTLKFPVHAYLKTNGFLALFSSFEGRLLICSKSSLQGEYVTYINNVLDSRYYPNDIRDKINTYCARHKVTLVCECVDPVHDPHIVCYDRPGIVLLDVVKNDFTYQALPYEEMVRVAQEIGLDYKALDQTFDTWDALYTAKKEMDQEPIYKLCGMEGYVFVDATGFMVKYKLPTYRWWKEKRNVLNRLNSEHTLVPTYRDAMDIEVFSLMSRLKEEGKLETMSIVDVERMYADEN